MHEVRPTFTFGKIAAAVDLADAQTEAARAQAALTAAEVAFGVRQAYLSWTQAQGIEAQLADQVKFTDATVAEARARFKAGAAPKLDVTRAETSLAQARAALATARATTGQARRSLAAAIGETTPIAGEPAFPAVPAIAARPLAELQSAALAHPSLRAQDAQLAQAQAARAAADRAGTPDINGDASYGVRARDFAGQPNYQFGVNVSWPLFSGFNVTNRAEAAAAREDVVREARADVRLAILRDVDNAYLGLDGQRQALPAAKAALAAARANLTQAQADARRFQALGAQGFVSRQQAEQAIASANALAATVQGGQAQLQAAQVELAYATVRSPIDGVAGTRLVDVGNLVRAGDTTPLVTINRVTPAMVRFSVPQGEIDRVRRYQAKAPLQIVATPRGGAPHSGTLVFFENAVDAASGTLAMQAKFANTDQALIPGQFVDVAVTLEVERGQLVAPTEAILRAQDGHLAFVVQPDGTVAQRPVKVARVAGAQTLIAEGLKPGDKVVTDGTLQLRDGAKVDVRTTLVPPSPKPSGDKNRRKRGGGEGG